ncbi:FAD-dependent oxidoreductase [Nitratireductor sp. L1-7-SE]|uniref:FAD-dependent oxidoreductase n=1 Tax=Nitratireductor rhodophyticola TaxID=2854036 RepID=A0ABS7R8I1_9HYPH|nr:FAD-dependent oxidoreductase [Nitratireductor rhodophyticola]MBY8917248.1 FAD-dependent oxidoreductase [Nitratireductor rhodophyticola]MBY8920323.1 FAD-dependent oxidoreductase [Nitratireductor rhodophyticola]
MGKARSQGNADVAIIGGGIIGIATAFRLAEAGRHVTLIERDAPANAASRGNAGAFAFPSILPLASPGILFKAPKWLFDPLGPLSIPPAQFPSVLPWLLRFFRASMPDRIEASTAAQAALNRLSETETATLTKEAGLDHLVRHDGALELYESEAAWRASLKSWERCEKAGVEIEHVEGARLAELQPGLSPRLVKGVFLPQWKTVSDPRDYALALLEAARARGVQLVAGAVSHLADSTEGVMVTLEGGRTLKAGHAVLAAGPWSNRLTALLGERLPVTPERGYNTTLPPGSFDLKRQVIFPAHGFVVTPLATGIRVGGASELADFDAPVNYKRARHMLDKAAGFLPGLKREGGTEWMGSRPSMPDSLPVIGRASSSPRILYAFGHGHLGLTQSAATARLVADLILERTPPIDISPFRPGRF